MKIRDLNWRLEFSLFPLLGDGRAIPPMHRANPSQSRAYRIVSGLAVDGARTGRLMRAAADAAQPGGWGMRAVVGAAANDNEWLLVRIVVHEAAHAVVAERWGIKSRIEIGRGDRFGSGVCYLELTTESPAAVRRQIGLAGMMADLQAEHGCALTLPRTIEAVRQQGAFSTEDVSLMGGCASQHEIDVCQRRVQHQWNDVIELARQHLAIELRHYQV